MLFPLFGMIPRNGFLSFASVVVVAAPPPLAFSFLFFIFIIFLLPFALDTFTQIICLSFHHHFRTEWQQFSLRSKFFFIFLRGRLLVQHSIYPVLIQFRLQIPFDIYFLWIWFHSLLAHDISSLPYSARHTRKNVLSTLQIFPLFYLIFLTFFWLL